MFQTNELVRVKDRKNIKHNDYCHFVPLMNKYCGNFFSITAVKRHNIWGFRYYELKNDWKERFMFLEDWLEPVEAVKVDDFPETITTINITDEELDAIFQIK